MGSQSEVAGTKGRSAWSLSTRELLYLIPLTFLAIAIIIQLVQSNGQSHRVDTLSGQVGQLAQQVRDLGGEPVVNVLPAPVVVTPSTSGTGSVHTAPSSSFDAGGSLTSPSSESGGSSSAPTPEPTTTTTQPPPTPSTLCLLVVCTRGN